MGEFLVLIPLRSRSFHPTSNPRFGTIREFPANSGSHHEGAENTGLRGKSEAVPGMGLAVSVRAFGAGHFGVDLRRGQAGVPQ